jgi:hypothetical protein
LSDLPAASTGPCKALTSRNEAPGTIWEVLGTGGWPPAGPYFKAFTALAVWVRYSLPTGRPVLQGVHCGAGQSAAVR